jgi:hypothetical protein
MKKKLRLHRETLRTLFDQSLNIAAGGTSKTAASDCFYASCLGTACPTDVGCAPDTNWVTQCIECEM